MSTICFQRGRKTFMPMYFSRKMIGVLLTPFGSQLGVCFWCVALYSRTACSFRWVLASFRRMLNYVYRSKSATQK